MKVRVFYKGARTRLVPASEETRVNMLITFSWVLFENGHSSVGQIVGSSIRSFVGSG